MPFERFGFLSVDYAFLKTHETWGHVIKFGPEKAKIRGIVRE